MHSPALRCGNMFGGRYGIVSTTAVDSIHVNPHRSASGAKGGTSSKPSDDLAADGRPKFMPFEYKP